MSLFLFFIVLLFSSSFPCFFLSSSFFLCGVGCILLVCKVTGGGYQERFVYGTCEVNQVQAIRIGVYGVQPCSRACCLRPLFPLFFLFCLFRTTPFSCSPSISPLFALFLHLVFFCCISVLVVGIFIL